MSAPSSFGVTHDEATGLLAVVGDVDMVTSVEFLAALRAGLERSRELQLDLAGVTFFGSEGVRCLATTVSTAADLGVAVVVVAASPIVDTVLRVTDMESLRG